MMTMTPEDIVTSATQALTDDGDTFDLPNGQTLRLRREADDSNPFDESDFYGRISWVPDRPWDREGMRTNHRPSDFDGNAEKLRLQQNNGCIWWQPPQDVKRTDPHFSDLRNIVNDLASFGYIGLVVELLDGEDAYGRPIVVNTASLWGIEPFPDASYVAEVVGELVAEVLG